MRIKGRKHNLYIGSGRTIKDAKKYGRTDFDGYNYKAKRYINEAQS